MVSGGAWAREIMMLMEEAVTALVPNPDGTS